MSKVLSGDFSQEPTATGSSGKNGNGNSTQVTVHRLDRLEERMSAVESKVDSINDTVIRIETGMVSKNQLILAFFSILCITALNIIGWIIG